MAQEALPALRLQLPITQFPIGGDLNMALVARLVASGAATSKAELAAQTGLARTTVTSTVEKLTRMGYLTTAGLRPRAGRGRPAETLTIAPDAGCLLVFDCGITSVQLAVITMKLEIIQSEFQLIDLTRGPDAVVPELLAAMRRLLDATGIRFTRTVAVVGLPARIDYRNGSPVRPATMPLWDGFPIAPQIKEAFGCDVIVENDANLRGLGESRALPPDQSPLLSVKMGTGIGAGLITEDGLIHRGSAGASGEMGHMTLRSAPPTTCSCGNVGCLEAVASTPVLLARYRAEAAPGVAVPQSGQELAHLVLANDELAVSIIRDAAGYLGEAIAHMVNIFNPARVVISGVTASASDDLLAMVRSMVYQHARPLATRNLQVAFSSIGHKAGLAGATVLGVEHLLSANALAQS